MNKWGDVDLRDAIVALLLKSHGATLRGDKHCDSEKVTFGDIEKLGGKVFHLRREHSHLATKVVERHHRWNGGGQPDRGSDQCLSDTRRDRLNTRRLGMAQAAKGVHNSPHRAEQPDKR